MTKPAVTITHGIGLLDDCYDFYLAATGTADAGSDWTHTVDAERTEGNDVWNGSRIYFTSGRNVGLDRLIFDFDAVTDTITHDAFPNPVASGDKYKISKWAETEDGALGSNAVLYDDLFWFYVSPSVGNKIYYQSYPTEAPNHTNHINLISSDYPVIYYRYKTSDTDIKAKIVLVFSDTTTQTVLDETNSTTMKTGFTYITPGKTIDHIRLYANQNEGDVYYDFFMICKGIFTFPNTQYGSEFTPPPHYALISIPSRIADVTQNLGSESASWTASCNLDIGSWKRTGDYVKAEVFMDIAHNSYKEPFQWLDTGLEQFKVTLETLRFPQHSDSHTLDLTFREYSRSSKSNESYVERFGLNR